MSFTIVWVALITALTPALAAPPPLFTDLAYEEARAAAAKADKLFVVDATAEWCPPCKQMDRTTWVDESVVKWFEANAIASQVDVDHQRQIATDLKIRAMPTVIAFKGNEEVGRVVGYKSSAQLLNWLASMKSGTPTVDASPVDAMLEDIKQQEAAGKVDVKQRFTLARMLAHDERFDEAAEQYAWLWEHMLEHDPSMVGVRGSFLASEMERLAVQPGPLKTFTALRDRMDASFKNNEGQWEELGDWITLNEIIRDQETTLAWFDRNLDTEIGLDTLTRYEHLLAPLLIRNGRWADYARIQRDPIEKLTTTHQQIATIADMAPEGTDPRQIEQVQKVQRQQFRRMAGLLHAAFLAAGDDPKAWEIADLAIGLDDDPQTRQLLVSTAIAADQAEERHRDLLDAQAHAALLTRLNQEIEGG